MSLFLKTIISIVVGGVLLVGGYFAHTSQQTPAASPSLGASFTPVGGQTYTLSGAGVSSSATTVQLNSFTTPDGRPLVMSMFGQIGYAVIDPNSSTKIEDITFTGVTQNANGTAILTGVSRGMDFVSPYTASTSLANSHAGGSYLILSNSAGFYGQQFLFANNVSTSSALLIFSSTTPPMYDGAVNFGTQSLALVDKAYVDSVAVTGAPTSTEVSLGTVVISPASVVGVGTASTTPGAPYVIENKFATTTPGTLCTAGTWNCIVATSLGKIAQSFLDLTASFTVTGPWTFNTATTTLNATTSIAAATSTAPLILHGNYFSFPSVTATKTVASSTVWTNDGIGNVTMKNPDWQMLASTYIASGSGTTTLSFPARNNIEVWLFGTTTDGATNVVGSFSLNGDSTQGDYIFSLIDNVTFTQMGNRSGFNLGTYATVQGKSTFATVQIQGSGVGTQNRKAVKWTATNGDGDSIMSGAGIFKSGPNQITSISFGLSSGTSAANFGTGSYIVVYGSQN